MKNIKQNTYFHIFTILKDHFYTFSTSDGLFTLC